MAGSRYHNEGEESMMNTKHKQIDFRSYSTSSLREGVLTFTAMLTGATIWRILTE